MTAAEQLRALVKEATPGPWEVDAYDDGLDVRGEHAVARIAGAMTMGGDADPGVKTRALADARLIALAPQLAELVADMGEALKVIDCHNAEVGWGHCEGITDHGEFERVACSRCRALARLDVLFSGDDVT